MRRVVITGAGIVSSVGCDLDTFWKNLKEGNSGIKRLQAFDPSPFPAQIASEVRDFDPLNYMEKKDAKKMDRFIQFAVAAAKMAIDDAGFDEGELSKLNKDKVGVVVGSGIGGMHTYEEQIKKFDQGGWRKVSPFFIPMLITDMAAGYIAILYGFRGPNFSISTACATSNHSISEAYNRIKYGEADMMITGGTEAAITPLGLAGFCSARALSTKRNDEPEKASRPFDSDRDGFVMGEGAGILVLEELEIAKARGARIYAEIIGYGMSDDAYHFTAPCEDGAGAALSMRNALARANIKPEDVDYVNAHGTSTYLGDIGETQAIKKVFGEHAYKLKVSSTKSVIGHLLGATGAAEAIAVIGMIKEGSVYPTINLENPDEKCDLDYVPNKAIDHRIDVAMSNSFGFGGHNSTIVLKRYDG